MYYRPEITLWNQLRTIDPAVIGGLVVEHGERERAKPVKWYQDQRDKNEDGFDGACSGLRAAAKGRTPNQPTTKLPTWLTREARSKLKPSEFQDASYAPAIWLLHLAGLIAMPRHDDNLVTYLSTGIVAFGPDEQWQRNLAGWYEIDSETVIFTFWGLFDVEAAWRDGWERAVPFMLTEGWIDRPRVLDETLTAMSKGFSNYNVKWFVDLFTALHPTIDELTERQSKLLPLLSTDSANVMRGVLTWLATLDKANRLDDETACSYLASAVYSPVKVTASKALRLLASISKRHPDQVVEPAAAGLAHPHPDVQRMAAKLLTATARPGQVEALAGDLSPGVRRELGLTGGATSRPDGEISETSAWTPTVLIPALSPGLQLIADDLPDRLAAAIESPRDPLELELVLDGLARATDHSVLVAVAARATRLLARDDKEFSFAGVDHWLGGQFARLAVIATGGRPPNLSRMPQGQLRFLERRLLDVATRLRSGRSRGLLATPDDAAGWIAPLTLVERLNGLEAPPDVADLTAAMLRLAPSGRVQALQSLTAAGEAASALRHALGADGATRTDIVTTPWWVAASRVRYPRAADPLLTAARLGAAGQGVPAIPMTSIKVSTRREMDPYYARPFTVKEVIFEISCQNQREHHDPDGLQPTAEVWHRGTKRVSMEGWSAREWFRWAATTCPSDADHFLAMGLPKLVDSASSSEISASYDDEHILDALAAHPGVFGTLAGTAIAIGLSVHRAEDRVRAVDLVIDSARGGLTPEAIGRGLVGTAGAWTAGRVTTGLREASAGGASVAVVEILSTALPSLDHRLTGLSGLLDVLNDELIRTNRPAGPELRNWLGGLSGGSRSARTARAILAR